MNSNSSTFLAESRLVGPAGPDSDFSAAEFERRRAALRQVMRQEGLDAVLINNRYTHRYFSGHSTNLWSNPSRPIFSIYLASGEVYAVSIGWDAHRVAATASDLVVVSYGGSGRVADPALDAVHDVIKSTLSDDARIGYEGSSWNSFEITEAEMRELRGRVPNAKFVDISSQIWAIRIIKSEDEVQALREVAAINTAAFDAVLTPALRDKTEGEIYQRMSAALFEAGSEDIYFMMLNSGQIRRRFSPEHPTIFLDCGAVHRGYVADFDRYATYGTAPAKLVDTLARLGEVAEIMYEEIRPGRTWREANEAVMRRGEVVLPELTTGGTSIGKLAHGIGTQMPEPPMLSDEDESEILEGTAMCIEPSVRHPEIGPITFEEMAVVRSGGCELISDGSGATVREL